MAIARHIVSTLLSLNLLKQAAMASIKFFASALKKGLQLVSWIKEG